MDGIHPFSLREDEAREIKEIARVFFKGGNPMADKELKECYPKWSIFFSIFLAARDARYGNLLHLPFEGGAANQPMKTMAVIQLIQSVYIDKLVDEQNKAFRKR